MKLTHTNNSRVKVLKELILNVPKVQMKVNHTYIYMYVLCIAYLHTIIIQYFLVLINLIAE